jgi:hypothetical protein
MRVIDDQPPVRCLGPDILEFGVATTARDTNTGYGRVVTRRRIGNGTLARVAGPRKRVSAHKEQKATRTKP